MVDHFGHERKQDITHGMQELFQKDGVLHIQIKTGAHKLHKIKQLHIVTLLSNNIQHNGQEQPYSHQQRHIATNGISGTFLVGFIVVKVVDDFLVVVHTDGLIGLLRVQVRDGDICRDEVYFGEFVHEH